MNTFSMRIICLLVFLLPFLACAQNDAAFRYPQSSFDSDTCCWRKLAAAGQYRQAANLVVTYLKSGPVQNVHALKWHAGQLYAAAGNAPLAARYFGKTCNIFYRWLGGADGKAWYLYARGCMAFVKRQRGRLNKDISIWERKLPKDINYRQLVSLAQHWDKSYLVATEFSL